MNNQEKILEKLYSVLDANDIPYQTMNKGNHIRIYNGSTNWNFYPARQKFHQDGDTGGSQVGLDKLLDQMDLLIADPTSADVGMNKSNSGFDTEVLSAYSFVVRRGHGAHEEHSGISLPIDTPFSISPLHRQECIYWTEIEDDRIHIYLTKGSILVTTNKKVSYGHI